MSESPDDAENGAGAAGADSGAERLDFYSPEWIAAYNDAVAGVGSESVPDDNPAEPAPTVRMVQIVHGAPGGTVVVGMSVSAGRLTLELDPPVEPAPVVTISVAWEDAAALARGETDPAQLLGSGRVTVRGALSALVEVQDVVARAAKAAAPLSQRTAYG